MRAPFAFAALLLLGGCAHSPLSGSDLDRVVKPAFISRIEEEAGPRSLVFRDDTSYGGKLKKLDPKEADRRLQVHLGKSMNRFEISDGLRAKVLGLLPSDYPWTNLANPAAVAAELQSFLVEEVPANPPDYDLLLPLGVDAVIEFVVERYGMRSDKGRAGFFIEGYGRMFFIDGRKQIWRRNFYADQVEAGSPHVDPFRIAKEAMDKELSNKSPLARNEMLTLIDGIAAQFAKDLTPPRAGGDGQLPPPDEVAKPGKEKGEEKKKEDNSLPDPDPL